MATLGSHVRKLKAVELVVQIERLKLAADRDLDMKSILARAKMVDEFTTKFEKGTT